MNQILDHWDTLINETTHPEAIISLDVSQLSRLSGEIAVEKNNFRKFLLNQIFDAPEEKDARLYIQRCQRLLISFMDKLHEYSDSDFQDEGIISFYTEFGEQIQSLLDFIESDFRKYFNIDEQLPASYAEVSKQEIKQQYASIRKLLAARTELDLDFVDTLHRTMEIFYSADHSNITYRDLIYHKELIRELGQLGRLTKNDCMYSALKELLIYMDFNSPLFINYFMTQFKKEATVEMLLTHQREIDNMHVKAGYRLYPELAPVKQQLEAVIQKEIEFIRATGGADPDPLEVAKTFVLVPFKGAVVYVLAKAFVDAGGAMDHNYKTFLEKIAPSVATKTQRGFRAESLCKYSDKVDPDTKETAKRFLQKMIRNIESYD